MPRRSGRPILNSDPARFALYRAITWRLWREQRVAIVVLPLLLVGLLGVILLATHFSPQLLTGPTLQALRAAAQGDGLPAGPGALSRAFIEHQAPYLLALFAGMSAASVSARMLGDEADRGTLELLLATRHDVHAIGGAMLLAATTIAGLTWAILWVLATAMIHAVGTLLGLELPLSPGAIAASVAMQMCLAWLSAEVTMIVMILWPGLARIRTGLTGDPMMLVGALPPLLAFVAANLLPEVSVIRLCLVALAIGVVLSVLGAASLRVWFRPERFLES